MNPLAVQDERGPRKRENIIDSKDYCHQKELSITIPSFFKSQTHENTSWFRPEESDVSNNFMTVISPLPVNSLFGCVPWKYWPAAKLDLSGELDCKEDNEDRKNSLIIPIQILVQTLAELHSFTDQLNIESMWPALFVLKASFHEEWEERKNGEKFCKRIAREIAQLGLEQYKLNLIKLAILRKGLNNNDEIFEETSHIQDQKDNCNSETSKILQIVSMLGKVSGSDVTKEYFGGNTFLVNSFVYRHLNL